jgi:phage-related protein (TIGR01555 family)
MGAVVQMWDRLTNALSGKGTSIDRRVYNRYSWVPVSSEQAEAWYRSTWLGRKIVDVPPFDMTREGRDWQAAGSDIAAVEKEEKRLQLWPKLQRALILARLYGGGGLLLGDGGNPEQPIDAERITKGGLKYVQVYSRHHLNEGGNQRPDPEDPWFGFPDFFTIATSNGQQLRIHPSRIVAFVGQRPPEGALMSNASWFWGDPIYQSVKQAVENADLAQDGFADLINEAKIDILKIPDLTEIAATSDGETRIANRAAAAMAGKSNYRTLFMDAVEDYEQKQITWAGMPDLMFALLQTVAGAADIPITRLLGTSPKGLQSTGDGEERDYQAMVRARQNEMLAPALDRIDDLLIRSALGNRPPDVYYEFAPLRQMDEKDAADIETKYATALKTRSDTGEFQGEMLAKAELNRMVESGRYPGLEAAIEEAANEGAADPDAQDPSQLQTMEQRVTAMEQQGAITAAQKDRLLTDSAPRSLYVSRKLLNADALVKWAKGQGFDTTVPAGEMHVTLLYSRSPVDWMKMGSAWDQDEKGQLKVPPGGARMVTKFDGGAVVLLFNSSSLSWRHEDMVRNGASHDFDEYAPHVTVTYEAPVGFDPEKVEPYRGELIFGPEVFEEVNEDWKAGITEGA